MTPLRRFLPTVLVLLSLGGLAAGCGCDRVVRLLGSDEREKLHVCVEIAESEQERRQGLKGRETLAPEDGLLIAFPLEGEACIANEGVSFPIDVVYAGAEGEVVAVERGVPADDATARCHAPVLRVLEVAAGVADPVEAGDLLR